MNTIKKVTHAYYDNEEQAILPYLTSIEDLFSVVTNQRHLAILPTSTGNGITVLRSTDRDVG